MRDKINNLRSQIHTLVDMFYDDTGWLTEISVDTKEVEIQGKGKVLASDVQVRLK
jgi:hypothetical protein